MEDKENHIEIVCIQTSGFIRASELEKPDDSVSTDFVFKNTVKNIYEPNTDK